MKHQIKHICVGVAILSALAISPQSEACTNLIAGKKATADGSVMVTYAADSHNLYGMLTHTPAAKHQKGALCKVYDVIPTSILGRFRKHPRLTMWWEISTNTSSP